MDGRNRLHKARTLQGVTIEGKRQSQKTQIDKQDSTVLFSGNDRERIILPEDDPAFLSSSNLYLKGDEWPKFPE